MGDVEFIDHKQGIFPRQIQPDASELLGYERN